MAYKPGDYKVICDICGLERYASECRLNWEKQMVCSDTCWEDKHPQFIEPTGRHERQTVPIHRPEGDPVFVPVGGVKAEDL